MRSAGRPPASCSLRAPKGAGRIGRLKNRLESMDETRRQSPKVCFSRDSSLVYGFRRDSRGAKIGGESVVRMPCDAPSFAQQVFDGFESSKGRRMAIARRSPDGAKRNPGSAHPHFSSDAVRWKLAYLESRVRAFLDYAEFHPEYAR